MKRLKELKEDFSSLGDFKIMIEAYEEISAIRMRKVKKTVLNRREFMQGLNEAFAYIAYAYKIFKSKAKSKKNAKILNTNGKEALVLVSSNTGLYGDIIRNTFDLFMKDAEKYPKSDLVIAGRLGKNFFENSGSKRNYAYFDISDTGVDEYALKGLLSQITNYTDVIVYHGVFKSILSQEPEKTHITGEVIRFTENSEEYNVPFLFEPNIKTIAEYFEKQILSLIFEQSLFESSLSKFASRMVSLDSAAANINKKIGYLDFDLKKAKHKEMNSSIQASFAGGNLWN